MKYYEIEVNDEVYWNRKHYNDDITGKFINPESNVYTVVRKYADMGPESIVTITDGVDEYEVYISELS